MAKIFISYRRTDTEMAAGRLAGDLRAQFGDEAIFRDKENIAAGADWEQEIRSAIGPGGVVLVLIGKAWLATDESGRRRIDDQGDAHRGEVAAALKIGCPVIPMLVDNTPMPRKEDLPEDIQSLTRFNALKLRDDEWEGFDFPRLGKELVRLGIKRVGGAEQVQDRVAGKPPWSGKLIAGLVLGVIAFLALAEPDGIDTYIGVIGLASVGLVLSILGWRDARSGLVRSREAGVVAMVIASLALLGGMGGLSDVGQGSVVTPHIGPDPISTNQGSVPPPPAGVEAPVPALPAPPALSAYSLGGVWYDAIGRTLSLIQTGNQLEMRDVTPGSPSFGMVMSGVIQADRVSLQGEVPGEGRVSLQLALLPDGRSMNGTLTDTDGTKMPFAFFRVGP